MPIAKDIFSKLNKDCFFSKIDLSKGYWQIPMEASSVPYTGFVTDKGSFVFLKMPFGMKNSGATFNRMMRTLLDRLENTESYIDDILIHTETWNQHILTLDKLFFRIKQAGLTVRPSKCVVGETNINFLSHVVSEGTLSAFSDNIQKVKEAVRPKTKKQVRSFIGLVNHFRNFIPNFAAIAVPLTDMTKKGKPNHVEWSEAAERAFITLKESLIKDPILKLPDFTKRFYIQTDASEYAIGSVLMQRHGSQLMPVVYASQKLLPRECKYSTMEKECLALVWAIKHFKDYLYGREFTLQTDHQPLIYLNKCKVSNSRIMRWALFLQPYSIHIEAIKGSENVGADYMSRIES